MKWFDMAGMTGMGEPDFAKGKFLRFAEALWTHGEEERLRLRDNDTERKRR